MAFLYTYLIGQCSNLTQIWLNLYERIFTIYFMILKVFELVSISTLRRSNTERVSTYIL